MSAQAREPELVEAEREIRAGRYLEAEKRLAELEKSGHASARLQHLLGACLHGQDKLDRSIACYRKAVKLDPLDDGVQSDFGDVLAAKGRAEEALACYREALRQRPEDERACMGAAAALQAKGELSAARGMFQRALRLRLRRWLLAPFRLFRRT